MSKKLDEALKEHPRIKNMVGHRYGKLTVVDLDHLGKRNEAFWLCRCDCGNMTIVNTNRLKYTVSCGCLIIEKNHKRREDLTGRRFGRLKVLSYDDKKRKYLCKCDCGNTKYIYGGSLLSGYTKSCGCIHKEKIQEIKLIDIAGQKFSMLTAIEYCEDIKKWKCRCDCGNITYVTSDKLRSGHTKSCGCIDTAHRGSQQENEIKKFILDNFPQLKIIKAKTILDGYEIDMYIPKLKIGIEYNGSAFHASVGGAFRNLDKYYHRDKFLKAKEKGIRLITVFDKDYEDNKELILSNIKHILQNKYVEYFIPVDKLVYTNNDYDDGIWLKKYNYEYVGQKEPSSFIYSNRFTVYRCGQSIWRHT